MKVQPSEPSTTARPVIVSSFGPPTLACIRSWGKQGYQVGMVCIGTDREALPRSAFLTDYVMVPPDQLHTINGIQIIDTFLRNFRATGIVCIDEKIACWLNDNKDKLPPAVAIWLPPNDVINDLISKKKQIEIARKVGFEVLPTYFIDKDDRSINNILSEHYPLCLRPDNLTKIKPTFKLKLVYSATELKQYMKALQKVDSPIVAQPFMNLPNLVVHGARTASGTPIGLQGFLVERKFEGVTLTIRPTRLSTGLRDKCIDFTNHFELTGNYHFEFLIDRRNGVTYFLELNNRLGGTTAKVYACGYDEPLLALNAYGVCVTNKKQITDVIVSSKWALLKYLYYTIRKRVSILDYPIEPALTRILKAIYGFLTYKDDVLTFQDIRGSLAMYLGNLKI